ncbi:acyltransferase family protein [Paraglaciecola sp.]|uniref:acyltransferase family protein n=1 Tax=Paraglaciecola sp. TaxID=1920173 RepID=UPI003EF268B2
MSNMKHQPHIDGLRALAVIAVLIFHINPSWLPGGFVGVDIFFVISGFLITSIIVRELKNKKFSIANFYSRRIKRILPVYFSVAISVLIVGGVFFFPEDLVGLAKSLLSSSMFVSNYYFWLNSGYFSKAVELTPLIHTWSLSVEEQFYIFWPLCLMVIFSPRLLVIKHYSVFVIFSVSFVLSVLLSKSHPDFAYYAIFTRTYELMIGAIFALYYKRFVNLPDYMSLLAFIVLICSVFLIDKNMLFPGYIAIFPCLATGVLIVKGAGHASINKFLSFKWMQYIGLLSYSLYMWHWPIISFTKYYFFNPSLIVMSCSVVLIIGVSIFSRRFIEEPFLRSKITFLRATFLLFIIPTLIIGASSLYIIANKGLPSRYNSDELALFQSAVSSPNHCSVSLPTSSAKNGCEFRPKSSVKLKHVLIWGDSHANHLYGLSEELSNELNLNIELIPFAGCPPIRGVYRINRSYSEHCYNHNSQIWQKIVNKNYDIVFLAANWANYPLADNLADDSNMEQSIENSRRTFYSNLKLQFELLESNNQKVWFLDALPNFEVDPKRCQLHHSLFRYTQAPVCETSLKLVEDKRLEYDQFILENVKNRENVNYFSLLDTFCADNACSAFKDNKLYFSDKNHLSYDGAKSLAPIFVETLDK